jgi:hypothetical protein
LSAGEFSSRNGSRNATSAAAPAQSFVMAITAIFFVLQLVKILHHPMWRDEMQVWQLARQSNSITTLLYLKRYEGHPDAWYVLVYLVQRLSSNPLAMQLLHLFIATVSAYILLRYSPFSKLQKVLAVFGYFLFFEYATISRGYALGVLCLFGFCAAFRRGSKRYGRPFVLLAALAQTSAYGLILAAALAAMILYEHFTMSSFNRRLSVTDRGDGRLWVWVVVFVLASNLAVFRIISIGNQSNYSPKWNYQFSAAEIGYALTAISRGMLPIPELTRHFWNTHVLHGPAEAAMSLILLCTSALILARARPVFLAYGLGLFGILLLRHLKPDATHFLRHDGHVFLLFIACVWLSFEYCGASEFSARNPWVEGFSVKYRKPLLTALLTVQAVSGVLVSGFAYATPFSEARATADYLRSAKIDGLLIVGDPDYAVSTVAGYLNRPILFVSGMRMGTSVVWDSMCCVQNNPSTIPLALEEAAKRQQDVLVLVNYIPSPMDNRVREIASFQGAIVADENYHLYRIRYRDVASR